MKAKLSMKEVTKDADGKYHRVIIMQIHGRLTNEQDQKASKIETLYNFESTGGILSTVEKCNGSGDCRKLSFARNPLL